MAEPRRCTPSVPSFLLGALVSVALASIGCKKNSGPFEGEIGLRVQRQTGAPTDMIVSAAGERVRLDLTSIDGKKSYTLVRPDGKAILVMDSEHAWTEMDLLKAGAAVAEADPGGNPTVTKTGKKQTVADYDCEIWEIKHANGSRTESCIAEGLAAFDFGALLPGGAPLKTSGPAGNEVHEKKMFPLRSVEFDPSGKETSRMIVTRIDKMKIDPARFEVPANYSQIKRP
ncbi:DUF4412 domain-containing protein [Pendulispora brunnea]|uniref:DUF4412 domain-containing protein n=1 Tax=Pendulispora brunnea TaxID=2905690 RepID=A0ABZ2K0K7_9BACT